MALTRLVSRSRSRYGGYLVHLGVAFIAVGVVSSSFYQLAREATLTPGSVMTVGSYTITYQGLEESRQPGSRLVSARLAVSDGGGDPRVVRPGKIFYESFNDQPSTQVAIETHRLEDLYLVLAGWGDDSAISLVAFVNPMVSLIWIGGVIALAGGMISLWPVREPVLAPVLPSGRRRWSLPSTPEVPRAGSL